MKHLSWFVFLFSFSLQGQVHELGLKAGSANMISDIGRDSYIQPDGFFVTGLYRRNVNEWVSYRFEVSYAIMHENDLNSESSGRRLRAWKSNTSVLDAALMLEYNFISLNPYRYPEKTWLTPYLAIGLGGFNSVYSAGSAYAPGLSGTQFALFLPMAFGLKLSFRNRMKFVWEISPRYSFSDNLEGSVVLDPGPLPLTDKLGNDWMIYSGFSITFGWGKLPCYLNVF